MAKFEVKVKGVSGTMDVDGDRLAGTDQVLYIYDAKGLIVFSAPQAEVMYARQKPT